MRLLKYTEVKDGEDNQLVFQLWQHPKPDNNYTITANINGTPARIEGWNGWDYEDHFTKEEALKALEKYEDSVWKKLFNKDKAEVNI